MANLKSRLKLKLVIMELLRTEKVICKNSWYFHRVLNQQLPTRTFMQALFTRVALAWGILRPLLS